MYNRFLNGQPYSPDTNGYPTNNYTMGGPALQDPNQVANANTGILNNVSSGNARGSQMPNMKISQGEMLMRMGAAGVGAAIRGDSYIEAMGQTYGDIQDANRQAEADAYNAQQINAKAEALAAAKRAEKQEELDIENNQKLVTCVYLKSNARSQKNT